MGICEFDQLPAGEISPVRDPQLGPVTRGIRKIWDTYSPGELSIYITREGNVFAYRPDLEAYAWVSHRELGLRLDHAKRGGERLLKDMEDGDLTHPGGRAAFMLALDSKMRTQTTVTAVPQLLEESRGGRR